MFRLSLAFGMALILVFSMIPTGNAWSNGGFTTDESAPAYGTHDWIPHHAIDLLPPAEKAFITANLNGFLVGTELPDNPDLDDGIGDTPRHHVYYDASGTVTDDVGAVRAQSAFDNTISFLEYGDLDRAARFAGVMSHYIADAAVWGHTMDASTPWGAEVHHSDFEGYVDARMGSHDAAWFTVTYDGNLEVMDARTATLAMAYNTTFGDGGGQRSNVWMDANYAWSDPTFNASATATISRAVNLIADVLHTIYLQAVVGAGPRGQDVLISEVAYDAIGVDSTGEWVELYNPTPATVNLTGWDLCDATGCYTLSTQEIAPLSFLTLSRDGARFLTDFGFPPDIGDFSRGLTNTGEELTLRDGSGTLIDHVAWGAYVPGWPEDAGTGKSIERDGPMADSDGYREWLGTRPLRPQTQANSSLLDLLLDPGWHLVSIPFTPADPSAHAVLGSLAGSMDMAWAYSGTTGLWTSLAVGRPAFMDTLLEVSPGQGLFLNLTRFDNLRVVGGLPTGTAISLAPGWNLVGYPSLTPRDVASALSGISSVTIQVPGPGAQGHSTLGPSATLSYGHGYWIHSQDAQVWVVPA